MENTLNYKQESKRKSILYFMTSSLGPSMVREFMKSEVFISKLNAASASSLTTREAAKFFTVVSEESVKYGLSFEEMLNIIK